MSLQVKKKSIIQKIILSLVVVLIMLSSIFFVACSNKSQELRGTLLADTQTFANGNLDYTNNTDTKLLLPTPNNWSYRLDSSANGSAPSSITSSGNIVVNNNTTPFDSKSAWDNFKNQVNAIVTRDARQSYFLQNFDWTSGYIWAYLDHLEFKDRAADKRPFYFSDITDWRAIPGMMDYYKNKLLKDNADFKEEELSNRDFWAADNYNQVKTFITFVKSNSILKNLTSNTQATTGFSNRQNSMLMLSNYVENNRYGTASQYVSNSITLPAGTMARLTVDVYTALSYAGNNTEAANLTITPTIAGNAQKELIVNNIQSNATWTTYTLYLQASQYADTSFTLSLGLGRYEGNSILHCAEGYAFFDNVTYQVQLAKDMKSQFAADITQTTTKQLNPSQATIVAAQNTTTPTAVVYNCDLTDTTSTLSTGTATQTQGATGVKNSTFNDYFAINTVPNASTQQNLVTPMASSAAGIQLNNSHSITNAVNGYIGNTGIPTTINQFVTSGGNTSFSLGANQKAIVGFWVNSNLTTTINLVEENPSTASNPEFPKTVGSISVQTTKISAVNIVDDLNGRRTDIYTANDSTNKDAKWQYVQFFIASGDKASKFSIQLQVGLTSFTNTTYLGDFARGTAILAQPNVKLNVTESEYNMHTANDYCKEVVLSGESSSTGGFGQITTRMATSAVQSLNDSDNGNAASVDIAAKQNIAATQKQNYNAASAAFATNTALSTRAAGVTPIFPNYTGAGGNTGLVGGSLAAVNPHTNTGLLDKTTVTINAPQALATILTNWKNNNTTNNPLFSSKSPLLIFGQNYGYFASQSSSIAASAYLAVNLRLLLANNATAYIYLIDMSATDSVEKYAKNALQTKLGSNYKYDNNGNVVTSFENNVANYVFYLQSNGLWTTGSNGRYYANLQNYLKQTDTKHKEYNAENLVDANGNIIYYYKGERQGMPQYTRTNNNNDREYVQDFYAAVKDGSISQETFDKTILRTAPTDTNQLVATVTGTSTTETNWTDVNFFIANGGHEKKYRLEVFLGSRDGSVTVGSNDWVIYETVKFETLAEENFNKLLTEYQNKFVSQNAADTAKILQQINNKESDFSLKDSNENKVEYWHYSLYDSGFYAPYNAKTTNLTSNPYSSYDASQYKKQIAYLQVKDANSITTIANFKAFENNVASSDATTKPTKTNAKFAGNIPLLVISSILIAAILAAVVVLLWRKLRKNKQFSKHSITDKKLATTKTPHSTKKANTKDVLPNKDEIDSEELYNFTIEENNPTIDEKK